MNWTMSRADYADLPDRQTYPGVPERGAKFCDSAYPDLLFIAGSSDMQHRPSWEAYSVRFLDE